MTLGFFAADANFPDQILAGLNIWDRRPHDIYRIDMNSGAVQLDTETIGDVTNWWSDNNLEVRAARVTLLDGEIRVRDEANHPGEPCRSGAKMGWLEVSQASHPTMQAST